MIEQPLRKETKRGFILTLSLRVKSTMTEKSTRQEPEASGRITSVVSRLRVMNAGTGFLLFLHSGSPAHGMVPPAARVDFPTLINLI